MRHITLPMTAEEKRSLRAGESVLLSGTIYTARDCAHRRIFELLDAGKELPGGACVPPGSRRGGAQERRRCGVFSLSRLPVFA